MLLRRKLEALHYTEPLDAASASLVNHLVNDLIRTTDSYRSIKLQAAQYAQEVATFNTKVSTASNAGMQQLHGMKPLAEAMLVKITLFSLPPKRRTPVGLCLLCSTLHDSQQHICRLPPENCNHPSCPDCAALLYLPSNTCAAGCCAPGLRPPQYGEQPAA